MGELNAGGSGAAADAQVISSSDVAHLDAATLGIATDEPAPADASDNLEVLTSERDAAARKVERQEAHLAAAKEVLAATQAALDAAQAS